MTFNIDFNEAVNLRNAGVSALIQNLGKENAAKFISLFNYYAFNADDENLLIRDYTEWRKTQSWYNSSSVDEIFGLAVNRERNKRA